MSESEEIIDSSVDETKATELDITDETRRLAALLCHNLSCDIHNYFVHMIEQAAKPEKGLTAEQLHNAAHDFATILATIEVIINRHKNYIVHNDPEYKGEPQQ